jgi:lipopolysaccharide transport system permease protein
MALRVVIAVPGALWRWRQLILELVLREFRSRYANASIGGLWHLIQPLGLILVYTFVFSELMRARLPGDPGSTSYSIFLCAGLLPWTLFADLVARGTTMFLETAPLLKKSAVPRIAIPVVMGLNALLNFVVLFGIFLLWMAIFAPQFPDPTALLAPLFLLTLLGLALGTLCGVLNVFLRDIGQIVTLGLQFGFWLTPIVWPLATLPPAWQSWVMLNPLVPLVQHLQAAMLGQPPAGSLLYPAIVAAVALVLAALYFRGLGKRLVDEL